jgi:hypothetical protein
VQYWGLLEGGTVLLKAKASGKGLSYKWTPATGLDHDDVLNPVCAATDDISIPANGNQQRRLPAI